MEEITDSHDDVVVATVEAPPDGVEGQGEPGSDVPEDASTHTPIRRWVAAALTIATVVQSLLSVMGAVTGPVFVFTAALTGVTALVLFVWDALAAELLDASRLRKSVYVLGVVAFVVAFVWVGLATQPTVPLYRLGGTQDVAVVGFLAPSSEEQHLFDDVAASLSDELQGLTDGEVHDYTREIPRDALAGVPEVESEALSSWVNGFVDKTDAELVITGYGETRAGGQLGIRVALYISPRFVADAAELAGWYLLDEVILDRSLSSTRTQAALLEQLTGQLGGVTAFLGGLDAFQSGSPGEAIEAFEDIAPESVRLGESPSLEDLVLLFRGHAYQALATSASPEDRPALLTAAHDDYKSLLDSEVVARRARLSLAGNEYLTAAGGGCAPGSIGDDDLTPVKESLESILDSQSLTQLARMKATVNLAQVEMCRMRAGVSDDSESIESLLAGLSATEIPSEGPEMTLHQQIRALGHSIAATHHAFTGELEEAVLSIENALELDPRFERRALWDGLKSGWLLKLCRVEEAAAAQEESLHQLGQAVERERVSDTLLDAYREAFERDLAQARAECPTPSSLES